MDRTKTHRAPGEGSGLRESADRPADGGNLNRPAGCEAPPGARRGAEGSPNLRVLFRWRGSNTRKQLEKTDQNSLEVRLKKKANSDSDKNKGKRRANTEQIRKRSEKKRTLGWGGKGGEEGRAEGEGKANMKRTPMNKNNQRKSRKSSEEERKVGRAGGGGRGGKLSLPLSLQSKACWDLYFGGCFFVLLSFFCILSYFAPTPLVGRLASAP